MLKAVIIGAGAIARTHIEALLELRDQISIIGIADSYPDKAQELIQEYHLEAEVAADYHDLLKGEADVCAVCTPPDTHCGIAVDVLNAGKHVLIEKPMASSVEECDQILGAAQKNGKLVSVIAQSRYTDEARRIRKILTSEESGKLMYAEADSVWWRDNCYYALDWRGRWETEGGGCTLNHAVHHIDLLLWMAGKVSSVVAIMANENHPNSEEEDISMALLRFENGAVGRMTASLLHHGQKQRMVFETENAEITMPYSLSCAKALGNGFPQPDEEKKAALQSIYDGEAELVHKGHAGQWANLIGAIEGKEALVMTGEDGRRAIELIVAVYEAGTTGKQVQLPLKPDDPFYTKKGLVEAAPRFNHKTVSVSRMDSGPMILANEDYRGRGSK